MLARSKFLSIFSIISKTLTGLKVSSPTKKNKIIELLNSTTCKWFNFMTCKLKKFMAFKCYNLETVNLKKNNCNLKFCKKKKNLNFFRKYKL